MSRKELSRTFAFDLYYIRILLKSWLASLNPCGGLRKSFRLIFILYL